MIEEKAALRREIRGQVAALTPAAREKSDRALFTRFLALPQVVEAKTVLLFRGMGGEPDTQALVAELLRQGKRVLLPKVLSEHGMAAHLVTDESLLVRHPFGMLEPGEDCPLVEPGELDLVLVPGLCYDKRGYRLGQGGGYYDRYLPKVSCTTVGLCRAAFLQEAVPRGEYDRPVDVVLTEQARLAGKPVLG